MRRCFRCRKKQALDWKAVNLDELDAEPFASGKKHALSAAAQRKRKQPRAVRAAATPMDTSAVIGTHAWPSVTCLELARMQLRGLPQENDAHAANPAAGPDADGGAFPDDDGGDDGGGWGGDYQDDLWGGSDDAPTGSFDGCDAAGVPQPVPLNLDMSDAPVQAARGQVRTPPPRGTASSTQCAQAQMESRMQVRFAKRAKHVDIKQLKGGVERELRAASAAAVAGGQVGFQEIVGGLAGGDGGKLSDLSPHLCFICLLHLANEQSLVVKCLPQGGGLVVENAGV